jgi:hypothetical protein
MYMAAVAFLLLASCELVGVNAERNNPHDPDNPKYVPQPPENVRAGFLNFEEQRGWIHITWLSTSVGQTGYLIERALDGETFEEFKRTESADITQNPVHDRSMEFRTGTAYRVTSYIERDGDIRRKITDAVPLSFGSVSFVLGPVLGRNNRLTVNFRADRLYRDGFYFKVVAPDGRVVYFREEAEELENLEPNTLNPPLYAWSHDISPGLTISSGSRFRVSWYIHEDGQKKIVGRAEETLR